MMAISDEAKLYGKIRDDAYSFGIGKTPMIKIKVNERTSIYAKLEYFNKFRSVKDRAAFFMIKRLLYEGKLDERKSIVEGTSGNTGIAVANIARELGIRAEIIIPPAVSEGTKQRLRDSGAILIEADDLGKPENRSSTHLAIVQAKEKAKKFPNDYINLFQHGNIDNTMSHVYTTGPEICEAIGKVPEFAAIGMGTGGTITGIAKYLKSKNPKTKVYAIQPEIGSYIQGLRNYKEAKEKKLIDDHLSLIDGWINVTDEMAYKEVLELLKKHKVFVGTSSGANLAGAKILAGEIEGGDIVTVFPDSGEKYRSVYTSQNLMTEEEFEDNLKFAFEVPEEAIILK